MILNRMHKFLKPSGIKFVPLAIFFGICWFIFHLPNTLFDTPTSTIIKDDKGKLLGASIASDGQWRFPYSEKVPEKFKKAIITFEDEHFEHHLGFNPFSLARASYQNLKAGSIISGGSTIDMQVIRLHRKQKRTFPEKIIELFKSISLNLIYSKQEILALYTSNAPFGGNVVGLEAACWRYYGRNSSNLSWGEAATLAVLPNAPSLIYPGKNQIYLKRKRDKLLEKLKTKGIISSDDCELAKEEALPQKPYSLPNSAPHLLAKIKRSKNKGKNIDTSINKKLQDRINRLVSAKHSELSENDIHNISVIVVEINTGKVKAYVGNSNCNHDESGKYVDIIQAPRSSGSIFKPFLFASMLDEGDILPHSLVKDIPTRISGYAPKNFNKKFMGAVPASEAIIKSLNVPAVRMLRKYGLNPFYNKLKKLGLKSINQKPEHYGLSLILGGAETTLWEVARAYSAMGAQLNAFTKEEKITEYGISYLKNEDLQEQKIRKVFSEASIWNTFETMSNVERPREEEGWRKYASSKKIAWKTGTSFGHKDAWAIGLNSKYMVGVWVGNADNEGRPGLTGVSVAGPIFFDVFKLLPADIWFKAPHEDLYEIEVCTQSGYKFTTHCEEKGTVFSSKNGNNAPVCTYHKFIFLDEEEEYQVNSDCYPVSKMKRKSWFLLSPAEAYYYKNWNLSYEEIPSFSENCEDASKSIISVIYPEDFTNIHIPIQLNGKRGRVVFEVAHQRYGTKIHWHIDKKYYGITDYEHKQSFNLTEGTHLLTLIDENGLEFKRNFEVILD